MRGPLNSRRMHNRALHDILAAFVEEAAWQLAEEVSGGAEIPFELIDAAQPTRSSAPLYCYRPLTQRFLAERAGALARLPSYVPAVQGLMGLPDLPSYLHARGRRPPGSDARSQADAALQAFLGAMWSEATEFTFDQPRFAAAFGELEEAAYAGCALALVVTPVDGLVIESEQVALGDGLTLVRGVALQDAPPELRGDEFATVAMLSLEGEGPSLEQAGRRLRRLQTALRLWDDAEPALGPTAWARTDGAPWLAIPLATGLRRTDRRLPARARGGGSAARVLLAGRAPHAALGRACVGAAPVRARLRARHPARGADRLAAVRPRAAGRARRRRLRAPGRAHGRDLRGPGRARGAGRGTAPRDRDGARRRRRHRPPRTGRRGARRLARRVPARDPARRPLRSSRP